MNEDLPTLAHLSFTLGLKAGSVRLLAHYVLFVVCNPLELGLLQEVQQRERPPLFPAFALSSQPKV
jgi:hypothetical protein